VKEYRGATCDSKQLQYTRNYLKTASRMQKTENWLGLFFIATQNNLVVHLGLWHLFIALIIIIVPIRHHDHPARVHYCRVTMTRIWTVLCILSVTWPVMIQTRTSNIHLLLYTVQFIFLSSHTSLHSTLSALSLSFLSLPHFRGLRSVPLQPISSGLRPQAPPRFRDASSLGAGPILVTTTNNDY